MGTAIVVFHKAGNRSQERQSMPVARLPGAVTEIIATSGTSAATTMTAQPSEELGTADGGFATVFAVGANLWVTSAAAPVAAKPATGAVGTGYPILTGTSATFAVAEGDKIAAIEWA